MIWLEILDLLDYLDKSYNIGANNVNKYKGVQQRLFEMNEKILFLICNTL